MQYQAKTPPEYLEQLESDWRKEKLQEVRQIILRLGPELQETIEYKMLAYKLNEQTVFHLNAQRAYISLYVGNLSKIEGADALLQAFDRGKGCIRIKKSDLIHENGLEVFVIRTLDHWKKGGDTLC
jgi:uncharacterized protein YdhG (YjbR/CyaY superfamily)